MVIGDVISAYPLPVEACVRLIAINRKMMSGN